MAKRFSTLLAAIGLGLSGWWATPSLAQPPIGPTPQQLPAPNLPAPQPNPSLPKTAPQKTRDPQARPQLQPASIAVQRFSTNGLRCAGDLASASVDIVADLRVNAGPISQGAPQIDALVNGVSIGPQAVRLRDSVASIRRRAALQGGSGSHSVVFVLNGEVRTAPQTFTHACVEQAQIRAAPPGQAVLPNLAFGRVVYAQLFPGSHIQTTFTIHNTPQFSIRHPGLRQGYRRIADINNTVGAIPLPSLVFCPVEQDAYVTAEIVIELVPQRVANPEQYASLNLQSKFEPRYLDTRAEPLFPTGVRPTGSAGEGSTVERGKEWLVIYPALACTRNGVLEVHLDPENKLTESDERDNFVRIRYSTVP